jgi:glycosyltransferase involved in cell wall biosynthesis
MTSPLVSVLVTAYNREQYIAQALESVLAQSFGDFELLVVDDRSTDGTRDIACSYERLDRRVRVVVNERNLGQFMNRNRAAALAAGALLKYHDSDDVMYPHCLAAMVPALLAYPEAAFGLTTGKDWPGGPCPMLLTPRMSYQREFLGSGMFNAGPSGAIFRAEALRALGGFHDLGIPSDFLFWLRACARVPVLLLPADLFWYRIHPAQELQAEHAEREYAVIIGAVWAALDDAACPLDRDEREQARRNQLARHAQRLWRDVRRQRIGLAFRRLAAGPGVADWARYLRRPRRDPCAGTPRDAHGDPMLPRTLSVPTVRPRA